MGGHYKGKTVAQIAKLLGGETQHYRWKVLPKDVYRLQTPLRLPLFLTESFGKYFTTATAMEKESWDAILDFSKEFVGKPPLDDFSDGGDNEFPEGAVYEGRHKRRERNKALVKKVKADFFAKHGRHFCEACGFDFAEKYGQAGKGFIEAHHTIFVSDLAPGAKTDPSDMALVCSNCHRILHRKRPWLSIAALRKLLKNAALKKSGK